MTVIVFPYALSPYPSRVLYTPMNSRHFTIANGVHGIMDLTVPLGGISESVIGVELLPDVMGSVDVSASGRIKRILEVRFQ